MKKIFVLIFLFVTSIIFAANASNQAALVKLETGFDGRIGVYALNTANHEKIEYRASERFPFCSTSKALVAAAILKESETDPRLLENNIHYTQQFVNASVWTPITIQHVNTGMSVKELCIAAIDYSDNGAMNLLVELLGGTKSVTVYARSIGDKVFRLDRLEPDLNTAIPGDKRDTTTPFAMGNSVQKLTLGTALKPSQRAMLITWLKNNTTGATRIRAGVPKDWIVGDKTGTGEYGTNNDIAIIWPPKCAPIVLAIYTTQHKKDAKANDAIIVAATKIVLDEFSKNDSCLKTAMPND